MHVGVDLDGVLAVWSNPSSKSVIETEIAPHAVETLREMSAGGVRFSVVSSRLNVREVTMRWLEKHDVAQFFDAVSLGEDFNDSKLEACRAFGVDVQIDDNEVWAHRLVQAGIEVWMPILPHFKDREEYDLNDPNWVVIPAVKIPPSGWCADWRDIRRRLLERSGHFA